MKKMKTLLVCLFLFGIGTAYGVEAQSKKQKSAPVLEPTIRVAIVKDVNAALLEAKGAYRVVREDTKAVLSSGSTGKRFVVQPISEGLRWGEEYPDVYQISVEPLSANTMMYVNGMQYKGKVCVYSNAEGVICIVNEVSLEDYVKSTLSTQLEAPLSQEAMASYVIASRTAAYVKSLQNKERLWDVLASDEKYYGYGMTHQKNGVDDAVDSTKHIVLVKENAPVLNVTLSKSQAEELAQKGFDAKKILKSICPGSGLTTTVEAKPVR